VAQFDASLRNKVYDIYLGFNFINGGHRVDTMNYTCTL
jgi:hypothetical protein